MRSALLCLALLLTGRAADALVWPSDVERTVREMTSSDPATRRRAARNLISLPAAVVRRVGSKALDDADPELRVVVLEALIEAREPNLGQRVAPWLSDPEPRVRRAAAEALGKEPYAPALPALGRVLSDPDPAVRMAAARALGAAGAAGSVVSLLGRLDDPDPDVRAAVARALARIRDASAVVPLVGKLQDSRPNVRRAVAQALGELGDGRASGALALGLRDQDEVVRVAALDALGRLRAVDAVPTIAALLDEERRPAVRQAALTALARIPSETGLAALLRALETDDPRERSPVRAALREAGDRAAAKLEACLAGQPPYNLADGCALALGEMQAESAVRVVSAAVRRGIVRPLAALRALGASGDPRGVAVVLEYLGSEDPWVRRAAVEAAASLLDPEEPDGRAVLPIVRAFEAAHARRSERAALVGLLGDTGSPRALPALAPVAKNATDPALRLAAIRALGSLGPAGQDAVLLEALGDERAPVRLAAAEALARTAAPGTAAVLLDRMGRLADQDRSALGFALSGALAAADGKVVARAEAMARSSGGQNRDALVEAIAGAPATRGSGPLLSLLSGAPDVALRAKVAEGLALHPEASAALRKLAEDADAAVRANAVWSLGAAGGSGDVAFLRTRLSDHDFAAAANAAAALGRIGSRGAPVAAVLCAALADSRAAVRANALSGLAASHARCPGHAEVTLLASDRSERVRGAAARMLRALPERADEDGRALARCAAEDPSAEVAAECAAHGEPKARGPERTARVSVFVVPAGTVAPAPRAPFALVRADGFVRYGVADSRGALREYDAPRGPLKLGTPAALVE